MHRQVHLAEPDCVGHPVSSIHRDLGVGILLVILYEPGALDKHTARSAGRIQDEAMIWLDDLDDEPDQAGRGEELPSSLTLLHRELSKEVFVDFPECITFDIIWNGREDPDQFEERRVVDSLVVLWQYVPEFFIFRLDGLHRFVDCLSNILSFRKRFEIGEAGLLGNEQTYP